MTSAEQIVVGVPKETFPGETLVAVIPAHVAALTKIGLRVMVECGAGEAAGFEDEAYRIKGAQTVKTRAELFETARILLQVRTFGVNSENGQDDLPLLRPDHILIGLADPLARQQAITALAKRGVTLFALERVPRIARAQSMDVLSSLGTIAGYKAVLIAATNLPKLFPMLTTAAGTIAPARVLIIGAGVTGLQAIATARRLGAVVSAYDVRSAAREEAKSLGARFIGLPVGIDETGDASGYAKALSKEASLRERDLLGPAIAASDVVITTAAVPGREAPKLITSEMVTRMARGSLIVDVAADRGGNCELTRPNEVVVARGVTVIGPTNLPGTVPTHASTMYSRNVTNVLLHLCKKGSPHIDRTDEIIGEMLVSRGGVIVHARLQGVSQ